MKKNVYEKALKSKTFCIYSFVHLNHMNGKDCGYLLLDLVDYTKRIDQSTGTNILSVVPEPESLF